ncbi:MAG: substrate-binding domain-containing protein [Anaerolineales bacterium]|nr:substrate-binding domain-containing protein [Anaerolineales bacterium]
MASDLSSGGRVDVGRMHRTRSGAGSTPAAGGEAAATTEAAAEPAAAGDFKPVWYAPAPHPYFEQVKLGVDAFEKDTGITVEKQIGPDWEQNSQNQRMEALAAKGFNAFSVYPANASGANGLYEELTATGINIANFGTSTDQPTTASFAVATDVKAAAMAATEELIKAMGGKGNIINILEVLTDPNTVLRKAGIEEVVAKYPDVKIIQEVAGMATTEEATQKVGDALSANIDTVDGIIATGYTPSVAIAQVLGEYKSKGGERAIHAVGIDTDDIVMQAIKDGVMDGTIVQNPYGHGYLSLMLLKHLADGYKPIEGVYFIDAGFAFANKDNLETYNDDILKVTDQIKNDLLTKYLVK